MQPDRSKLILVLISLACFIPAFVLNITDNQPLYNANLNLVPQWQNSNTLGSDGFIAFMNIVSILLDPPICAAYLAVFWLFSSRKLQIMVFLIWFIFLTWLLSVVKALIQQPRPYWLAGADIKMYSWTCYTDFGCPSGHSMMGLILLQFVISFYARWYKPFQSQVYWLYIILVLVEGLLMFSRVILGMHSFNQVLMGAMIGAFSLSVYYTYAQPFLIKMVASILNTKEGHPYFRNMSKSKCQKVFLAILGVCLLVVIVVDLTVTFIPVYPIEQYWVHIQNFTRCTNAVKVRSFQYRSLQDMAIIMAAFGIIIALMYTKNPSIYVRPLAYSRFSLKFVAKLLIQLFLAALPLAAFVNVGWRKIDVDIAWLSIILWICQSLGYFLALIMLTLVGDLVCKKLKMDEHSEAEYVSDSSFQEKVQYEMGLSPRRDSSY